MSAATAFSRIVAKAWASSGGGFSTRYGAASAWMATTDMWCATTSCSSRAMLVRSSRTVRLSRSTAVTDFSALTCRSASLRMCTTEMTSRTMP